MAKQKLPAGLVELPADDLEAREEVRKPGRVAPLPTEPLPAPGPSPADAMPGKYRCALNCPTPLAHRELVVEASTEQEAWEKFEAANGICGSRHDRTIIRVG